MERYTKGKDMKLNFERTASKLVNLGWAHGRYVDFWSLVHLLSGLTIGAFAWFLEVPTLYAFIAIAGGAILYEVLEFGAGLVEDAENSLLDILFAGVGASVALYGFDALALSINTSAVILIFALAGNIILIHQGWHAYLKRKSHIARSHKYILMALQGITLLSVLGIAFVTVKWAW